MLNGKSEYLCSRLGARLLDSAAGVVDSCKGTDDDCEEVQTVVGRVVGFTKR